MASTVSPANKTFDRASAISSVLASFRMEGLEPDAETKVLLEQYAAGSLSLEQLGTAIERQVAPMKPREATRGAA